MKKLFAALAFVIFFSACSGPAGPLSAEQGEGVWTHYETGDLLADSPEYTAAAASGAIVTGPFANKIIDSEKIDEFLRAFKDGDSARLELFVFYWYDYRRVVLSVENNLVDCVYTEYRYDTPEPLNESVKTGLPNMALLSSGTLYIEDAYEEDGALCRLEIELWPEYKTDRAAAYYNYMAPLEYNGMLFENTWEDIPPNFSAPEYAELVRLYEDGVNIWNDYPDGRFPAEYIEEAATRHFPDIPVETLRSAAGYSLDENIYIHTGGRGGAYLPSVNILSVSTTENTTEIIYCMYIYKETNGFVPEFETTELSAIPTPKEGPRFLLTVSEDQDDFHYVSNKSLTLSAQVED